MMELRELMKKLEISEDYIIKTAQKINSVCKLCNCEKCPFYIWDGCVLVTSADIRVDDVVKKRINKLLRTNYMEMVAEMFGLKLGQQFIVRSRNDDEFHCYLDEKGLKLTGDKDADCRNLLGDLLTGKAYIVKDTSKGAE